ncbi:MAG: OmpH family outer membrane protein [Bacteroidetes bacterium]|nr:OmpH family outer membrane protein [Bacteroidota bacterium]
MNKRLLLLGLASILAVSATAQQNIGYVDSEAILKKMPEYATVQQRIERLTSDWEAELREKRREMQEKFQTYQSRELLYTKEEQQRKREEIVRMEEDVERLRLKYFGPEGDLFTQEDNLMKPLQERILAAIEEVATRDGYDFVFDRRGDFLFLYAREQHDLSNRVLEELGLDTESTGGGR